MQYRAGYQSRGTEFQVRQDAKVATHNAMDATVLPQHAMTEPARLTYTATWGSYYREKDQNASVAGWIRGELQSNPTAGMRALTFLQSPAQQLSHYQGTGKQDPICTRDVSKTKVKCNVILDVHLV